jgi:basic amino acid/polyamine antiporter, APA family
METGKQVPQPGLIRGIGLSQAIALNVNNMTGIGPFITIPALVASMHGPQAMLGWIVGALLAACDGLVWAELSASLPGSGGTYLYLRESYGARYGRLMSFLFIWQVTFHAPLSFASGSIGFSQYLAYLLPGLTPVHMKVVAVAVALSVTALLYRRITVAGNFALVLLGGVLIAIGFTIVAGIKQFELSRALDFPPGAFELNEAFWFGLGGASLIAVYDYLGYYNICYIGGEVKNPERTIPRAILLSVLIVAVLYLAMNFTLLGSIHWTEVEASKFPMSLLVERAFGSGAATFVTVLILWTAFASIYSLLLGNSRIPYAAALDGNFFKPFGRLHPTERFPTVSLVVMGCTAAFFSLFTLGTVVKMLIVIRVTVQFIGQTVGLMLLRRYHKDVPRPFRMWFYPLPALLGIALWLFIFLTQPAWFMWRAGILLAAGFVAFLIHARMRREWPFESRDSA